MCFLFRRRRSSAAWKHKKPKGLPTELEINPIPGDLNGESAVKSFYGKTVADVVAMLDRNSLYYQEGFMWMGPRAFCFYLPAVLQYLNKQEDKELVCYIASLLEFRLKYDSNAIKPAYSTMIEICRHLIDQDEEYVSSGEKQRCSQIIRCVEGTQSPKQA